MRGLKVPAERQDYAAYKAGGRKGKIVISMAECRDTGNHEIWIDLKCLILKRFYDHQDHDKHGQNRRHFIDDTKKTLRFDIPFRLEIAPPPREHAVDATQNDDQK